MYLKQPEWIKGNDFSQLEGGKLVMVVRSDGRVEGGLVGSLVDIGSIKEYCIFHKVETSKQKAHPHAELMAQYAEDAKSTDKPWELWQESLIEDSIWDNCCDHPSWRRDMEYRRKPKTKLIHGVEVPDISFVPKDGEGYYIPDVRLERMHSPHHCCDGCLFTSRLANYGMCYPKTEEGKQAAILHAKAMLGIA